MLSGSFSMCKIIRRWTEHVETLSDLMRKTVNIVNIALTGGKAEATKGAAFKD